MKEHGIEHQNKSSYTLQDTAKAILNKQQIERFYISEIFLDFQKEGPSIYYNTSKGALAYL